MYWYLVAALLFFLHHSLSSSFRHEIIYVISFVLQVLLFDCIFSMSLLHQCRLERRGFSLGVPCFTLELCCLGLLWCDWDSWVRGANRAVAGGEHSLCIFWGAKSALALPFLCSTWHLNCSVIELWSCHGLASPQGRRLCTAAVPPFSSLRSAECSNCETKPGGKLFEGPCSALTEHG